MMEILIVDGYNVINCRTEPLLPDNLETARDKLVDILLEYGAYKAFRVIVVFDAHLVKGQGEKVRLTDWLEIIYTRENETADSRIEKLAYRLAKENRVYVVTSDRAEQMTVLGAGAFRMPVREFMEDVARTKTQIRRHLAEKELAGKRHELAKHLDSDVYNRLDAMRLGGGKPPKLPDG